MPSSPNYKRDYKEEYKNYQSSREQKKKRAKRNAARRMMEELGYVHKGDGKDVDHKRPLEKHGGNGRKNLRVQSRHSNRSFKRTKRAGMD